MKIAIDIVNCSYYYCKIVQSFCIVLLQNLLPKWDLLFKLGEVFCNSAILNDWNLLELGVKPWEEKPFYHHNMRVICSVSIYRQWRQCLGNMATCFVVDWRVQRQTASIAAAQSLCEKWCSKRWCCSPFYTPATASWARSLRWIPHTGMLYVQPVFCLYESMWEARYGIMFCECYFSASVVLNMKQYKITIINKSVKFCSKSSLKSAKLILCKVKFPHACFINYSN